MEKTKNLSFNPCEHNRGIDSSFKDELARLCNSSFYRTNTFVSGLLIEISKFSLDDSLSLDDQLFLHSLQSSIALSLKPRLKPVSHV